MKSYNLIDEAHEAIADYEKWQEGSPAPEKTEVKISYYTLVEGQSIVLPFKATNSYPDITISGNTTIFTPSHNNEFIRLFNYGNVRHYVSYIFVSVSEAPTVNLYSGNYNVHGEREVTGYKLPATFSPNVYVTDKDGVRPSAILSPFITNTVYENALYINSNPNGHGLQGVFIKNTQVTQTDSLPDGYVKPTILTDTEVKQLSYMSTPPVEEYNFIPLTNIGTIADRDYRLNTRFDFPDLDAIDPSKPKFNSVAIWLNGSHSIPVKTTNTLTNNLLDITAGNLQIR